MAIGADEFRDSLGNWATGVTIVTSRAGDRIHGMTVSDFCGVSLTPPLVAVCCSKDSITTGLIAAGQCFGVNILADDQEDLSNRFASKKHEHERFVDLAFDDAKTGAPLIAGCLANLDCSVVATHDAGDHVIYVGEIEVSRTADKEPLVHYGGQYRSLARSAP